MDDTQDRIARVVRRMGPLTPEADKKVWDEAHAQYLSEKECEDPAHRNPLLTLDCFENALDMLVDGAL